MATLMQRKFGITPTQYRDLLKIQGGSCAICQRKPKNVALAVDHCHKTGFVRGLLCANCNQGIARLEKVGNLVRATNYLGDAEERWDFLPLVEQDKWLPYRGRVTGKGRRARLTKARAKGYPTLIY